LRALGPAPWTRTVRVGIGEHCETRIVDFSESETGAHFTLLWRGELWAKVSWSLAGLFNARNAAMAATAAGLALDGASPTGLKLDTLAAFRGVKRRQEAKLAMRQLTVLEDFGHHPTALAETLHSFRSRFKGALLTAVFEPRSNTSMRRSMQDAFMRALARADEVYIGALNRPEKLSAAERFDPEAVAQQLETQGVEAHFAATNAALLDLLVAKTLPVRPATQPRVVVFFTNGSFDGIIDRYVTLAT
jgi:UDP-N-acetylmuramate: L-alanyl-gamma-D-glutamyl-meso-diaminopimelate ligase